jgi:hypothetical protein
MDDPTDQATDYQRRLFALLDEFFVRATGKEARAFARIDAFSDVVRKNAYKIAPRSRQALPWVERELRQFYMREGADAFGLARQQGGLKLVLGGSGRFLGSQLSAVSRSLLYADTILVPDPVVPWLEKDRSEERFRHVLFLQAVHAILHLKSLVDADLPYPAVLVFPSWEKSLEERDPHTQAAIRQLAADVFARYVDDGLSSLEDVLQFAQRDPGRFLSAVDRHRLFVAPGGPLDEPLAAAFLRYDADMETWRSSGWLAENRALPLQVRVLNAILERLIPQYHLLENAEELGSHPLLSLEQHAHYYGLVAGTNSARLERLGILRAETRALLGALGSKRLRWLGEVDADTILELRRDNENAAFRTRLRSAVSRLHESEWTDVDKVATEVCHEIGDALAEHDRDLKRVRAKYRRVHGQTATMAIGAVGALLAPSLAPFAGTIAPLALATKYAWDKINQRAETRTVTRSLLGVVALARGSRR